MGVFARGQVVLIRFPFTDLSSSKLRPALIVAFGEYEDQILCQITSKSYEDRMAISVGAEDFKAGGLNSESYIRPRVLFTASESIIVKSLV